MDTYRVGTLVVDSGALIKGASLESWSPNVVTVKDIISEIKDLNTRRRLQVLPYTLTFREPIQQALHHVTSFAKKTGDYASLSLVDLRLVALTYQLECELGPERGKNLREEPCKTQSVTDTPKSPSIVGFYSGSPHSARQNESSDSQLSSSLETHRTNIEQTEPRSDINCVPLGEIESLTLAEDFTHHGRNGENDQLEQDGQNSNGLETDGSNETQTKSVTFDLTISDREKKEREVVDTVLVDSLERNGDTVTERSPDREEDWNADSDDDEEDSWITPSNYKQACDKMGGALESKPNGIAVGCITTDYAMQNVMLQMGLNVISVDGMRIKQLRTYAMKCKACFKVTSNTGVRFCPNCGNQTMVKVSVVLDGEDGTVQYKLLSEKQYSHKGLRFSLPLPKGGRHANNPILAPDQRETSKQRRTRGGRIDPLHPDYIAQTSPFAMKDVNSRGAQISFAQGRGSSGKKGWRNNPNAAKPKGKKR